MIQRIQTVYLTLASIFNLIVYFTPLYDRMWEDPAGWIAFSFASASGIALIICIVAIFLYKRRPLQATWVRIAVIFQFISLGIAVGVLFTLGGIGIYLWDEGIGVGLLLLAIIGQILAIRGIKKDEELVRSMDRIR